MIFSEAYVGFSSTKAYAWSSMLIWGIIKQVLRFRSLEGAKLYSASFYCVFSPAMHILEWE